MAEQQTSPVIVEEQNQTPEEEVVNVTPATAKTFEEAKETGERLMVTPAKFKPTPEASVPTDVEVQVLPKPRITFKSLQPQVEESVERQQEVQEIPTYEQVLEKLDAGESVTIPGPSKAVTYSGTQAKLARTPAFTKRIKTQLAVAKGMQVRKTKEEATAGPVIPFVSQTGEIDVSYVEPELRDSAEEYAKGRKALDDALRPYIQSDRPDIDAAVRQYFIDDFATGEFFESLSTRLAESGRAVPTLPSYAVNYAGSFVEAARNAYDRKTTFGAEWDALAPKREQMNMDVLRQIDEFIPAPTLAMGMNDAIRERAKKELSPEAYEDFAFIEAADGSKIERVFITDEAAYEVVEEAFSQLNVVQQGTVMLAEGYFGGGILSKTKNRAAAKEVDMLIDLRKGLGLGDDIDLDRIPGLIRSQNLKTKLNNDLIELGLYNRGIDAQMIEAKNRIKQLRSEMETIAFDPKRGKGHIDYLKLKSEADNLQRLRNRNFFNTKLSPYMKEVVGAELSLAVAGTVGRNTLDGYMGMDGDTGELFGVLGGLAAEYTGIRKLTTKGLGKGVSGATGITLFAGDSLANKFSKDGNLNPVSAVFRKLTQQDMSVDDYERLYYKPNNNGEPMSFKQRRSLKNAFRQVETMDLETRERFLDTIQAQMDLEDRLLSMFPEGIRRNEAAKILSQSFAEATALPQAIAAFQMASNDAASKGIKKNGLGAMMNAAAEMDARVSKTQLLLNQFEEYAGKFGDPIQVEAMQGLIAETKNALARNEQMVNKELSTLSKNIDRMMESAITDITEPLEETFLEDYLAAREYLDSKVAPQTVAEIEGAVQEVSTTQQSILRVEKALLERFETIRGIRDKKALHTTSLETAVESLIFQRYGRLSHEMDKAYEGFRDFVATTERPMIDISPAVEKMMELSNVENRDISLFFGPESTFFSGYLGRKSRKMFERMVRRTIDELPEDEQQELFTSLVEQGVDAEDLQALLENQPTQFGLLLQQSGKLNVFARANIEEAEEFRRAFRDYGYKTANKAVSRQFSEFQDIIDSAMEASDKEGYDLLVTTRGVYRQLNDPNRKGTPLNRVLNSKVGDKVTEDSGGLAGLYANVTPYDVVAEMGSTVSNIMAGKDKLKNVSKLKQQIAAMSQLFGTATEHGMAIDLRTEEGQLAMDLMEEVIGAVVYDQWAGDFLKKRPAVGARIGDPSLIGFRQSVMDELEGINEAFNVKVIDRDGNPEQSLVFNITDMVAKEQDIAKLVRKGSKYHAEGRKAVSELKRTLVDAADEARTTGNLQKQAVQELQAIAGVKDPLSFYDQFIGQSATRDIDATRDLFVETMKRTKGIDNVEQIEKMFDSAIYNMTYQALLARGGYGPVGTLATTEVKGLLGEGIVVNGFASTLGAIAELESDVVRKNLSKIMDNEHIETLHDILQYTANQNVAQVASQAFLNNKGMSANEAISRAYNIARGMVSPSYVATEVTLRVLQKHNSDVLLLALQNKEAARIMQKMLRFPKLVTGVELNTFDTLVKEFLFTEVARKGQELALTDYFDTYLQEEQPNDEQ